MTAGPSPRGFTRRNYVKPDLGTFRTFPAAGYTVVRGGGGLVLTLDHGPLGMPPLHNHGHADALAITLSLNGKAVLVDPGTYRYNGEPEFRRYFKGTRAHNIVTVDGEDQAVQETGFIWSKPYKAFLVRTTEMADGILFETAHNGYARLSQPVEHRRTVLFFGGRHFLVSDTFTGAGFHDFELNYHLHPDVVAKPRRGWWGIRREEDAVFIRLLAGEDFKLVAGQETPPFGWFSPAYGIKLPSGVLSSCQRANPGEAAFLTAICVGQPADLEELQERAASI